MFQLILLSCFAKIKQDRSISSVYHILKGKKSAQTIQDMRLYDLGSYFGIYKSLNRAEFDEEVRYLNKVGAISNPTDNFVYLTNKGKDILNSKNQLDIDILNGQAFEHIAPLFEKRFMLAIQVASHLRLNKLSFIPIVEDETAQKWIKEMMISKGFSANLFLSHLYDELLEIGESLSNYWMEIFVDRITSDKQVGQSIQQLSINYNKSNHDIHLILTAVFHYIFTKIEKDKYQYKLLAYISDGLWIDNSLTISARKTYEYVQQGYTIETIAKQRNLKANTIYDHLIEIAYVDKTIKWQTLLPDANYFKILEAIKKSNTGKLKDIKQLLPESISYFQIRLVIALNNEKMMG
ncbi:helix-turn-helix domain-containing protein [Saliterribacillus persicus]|uniref:Uncharacterized protein YpbB n=1 Tax=Saliterribacillus persicus TaxID=930114 RepID=A0A368XA97_9BACI|nr:helix-turn-helix domain-containing protein [Saliterribacillus persicus]RCW64882.1 uncharacterized protein YpbB [Saliterribacillus persicus]